MLALHSESLADLCRDVRRLADALGVPERGVQLVSRLQRRLRSIAARAASRPRPRVACLGRLEPPGVAGPWIRELAAMAGGEDVLGSAGRHARENPLEALAAADPDAIFVSPRGWSLARTRAGMPALEARHEWRALRAVREGRVFLVDGDACFDRPGPRVAEALEVLAEALHPGAFRFGHEGRAWDRRPGPAGAPGPVRPSPGARAAR